MSTSRGVRFLTVMIGLLFFVLPYSRAYAQTSSSTSYSTKEYSFGTGGNNSQTSASYSARTATGSLGVNNSFSTSYGVNPGPITPDQPYIEFVVSGTAVNLGDQSPGTTKTGTATFYVRDYVSSGYVIYTASPAPKSGAHTMASPSSATASAVGTEQFGINLVANTSPATFGANPVQVPSSSFSFGAAVSGYNTANQYKYVNGDIIAQSTKSSGETDYTISYIFNISTVTPAGTYVMNHILVAVGTY